MSPARHRLLFTAALLAVSLHFTLCYLAWAQPFLDLTAFAQGHASLPFQNRALTGWILRGAMALDHGALHGLLAHVHWSYGGQGAMVTAVLFLLAFGSMAGVLVSTRASLGRLTGNAVFASYGCFLAAYMAYFNYIFSPDAHFLLPYDLPSLALFSVAFWLLLTGRIAWYYPVFVLACLNRETALFLALFFAVLEGAWPGERGATRWTEERGRRLLAHVALQVALWVAIKLWLRHLYGHNSVEAGSGLFEIKLGQNLGFLVRPQHWPTLLSNFGFLLPVVLWFRKRLPHAGLRRCLPILGLWFAGMMVVGVIIEIRIFGELISYMSVAAGLLAWTALEHWRPRAAGAVEQPALTGARRGS